MASELKLAGQTARVILQGNDTIAADQTFTFPDTGGQVLTSTFGSDITIDGTFVSDRGTTDAASFQAKKDGNVNAEISSAGKATFAGEIISQGRDVPTYQQGTWTPTCDKGALTPALAIWARIGNMVTVSADVSSFTSDDGTGINIISLPYNVPSSQAAGSCLYINCKAGYDTVFVTNDSSTKGLLQFYATTDSGAWDQLKYSNIVNGAMACKFVATYRTDDTTWTPINGAAVS